MFYSFSLEKATWKSDTLKKIVLDILTSIKGKRDITEDLCVELHKIRELSLDLFKDETDEDEVFEEIQKHNVRTKVNIYVFYDIAAKISEGQLDT